MSQENIRSYCGVLPLIADSAYVDASAVIIGDVSIAEDVSIWPLVAARGDMHFIRIGARSNIQDGSILHVTHASDYNPDGFPLEIGEEVTVGHQAVLHGCRIGNQVLVGMGATVMDGAVVEDGSMIAAGSLVSPGKRLESGYLYVGRPAVQARPLNEQERNFLKYSADNYVRLKNRY